MQRTIQDFSAVAFCSIGFCLYFLPPGYLFAHAVNLNEFRKRSLPEKILWAVSLSTPLSILLAVFMGRHFSFQASQAVCLALTVMWGVLLFWEQRNGRLIRQEDWNRPVQIAALIAFILSIYCITATLGITVGQKLYEGTYAGDWSVRIPLTAAAQRSGVPIATPFYAIGGDSAALRYYYYWYVLCGAAARLTHETARSSLAASSVWSALALFSTLFLAAKYLFVYPLEDREGYKRYVSLRWLCVLMLPVSCILGLDVLPSIISIMMRPMRLFPEMEWWRSAGDFSLSFHTAILYAPHHTAGLVCCVLGFIVFTLLAYRPDKTSIKWSALFIYALTAAFCFSAALGTSTYLTLIFGLICTALAVERGMRRDWRTVSVIVLAAVLALPLSATYLHEILAGAGESLHSGDTHVGHARFVALFPRNVGLPRIELLQIGNVLHYERLTPWWIKALLRPVLTLLLFVIELGFFGFVLAWRAWADLRRISRLSELQRMQWVLFVALAFAALFLTSQPVIGVNDLGRHAGLALRFVAVLWATPLLVRAYYDRTWSVLRQPLLTRIVAATIVLGLCSQLWQIVVQRSYFWLVDKGTIVHPFAPFPRFQHYGHRYFETREAFEAMNRVVPPTGHIQFNPGSTNWTLMGDYLERPVAAFDLNCQVPFGGDIEKCHEALPEIRGIFGGGHPIVGPDQDFDPAQITTAAFMSVCRKQHLDAVVATASDRVWLEKSSWLWTEPALFANSSVRIVACPDFRKSLS